MYICICSSITDADILSCSHDGCTFEEMKTKLCVAQNCGTCEQEAKALYDGYINEAK